MNNLEEINWIGNQLGLPVKHIHNWKLAQEINFLDSLTELYSICVAGIGKIEKGNGILWQNEFHIVDSCWRSDAIGQHCYVLTKCGLFISADTIEKQ